MDIDIHERAPEHKAGVPAEAFCTHEDVHRIFESYKQENEVRLAELAKRKPDPLTEQKLARLDARFDSMTVQRARPPLGAEGKVPPTQDQLEHKAAFGEYVRRGESANLRALEQKAMSA